MDYRQAFTNVSELMAEHQRVKARGEAAKAAMLEVVAEVEKIGAQPPSLEGMARLAELQELGAKHKVDWQAALSQGLELLATAKRMEGALARESAPGVAGPLNRKQRRAASRKKLH